MNYGMVTYILCNIMRFSAIALLIPGAYALALGEGEALSFAVAAAGALALGSVSFFYKPRSRDIYSKDGFAAVALAWVAVSLVGALPYVISGHYAPVDGLFESVSGFTTTGASAAASVEALPRSILLWRAMTHWIGGMGVLVFVMAVIPLAGGRSMHLMRAELSGPEVGKLMPKLRGSLFALFCVYLALTVLETALLLFGGLPVFDAVATAFSTAGTGGFSVRQGSIAAYGSAYVEYVVTVFMLLFGVNFALFFALATGDLKKVLKNEELRVYALIVLFAGFSAAASNAGAYATAGETIRHSFFQTATFITSTGFSSAEFSNWSPYSHMVFSVLMITGACAGSTGGGLKTSRVVVLYKAAKAEVLRLVHPRLVKTVKLNGDTLGAETVSGIANYFAVYAFLLAAVTIALSLDGFDLTTTFSAASSCFNNVGLGFGGVGPSGGYTGFSPFSKLVMCVAMLFGRLEIYPLILLLAPGLWTRRAKSKL